MVCRPALSISAPAPYATTKVADNGPFVGLDDVTMQTVHASHRYFAMGILWGARLADVLSETPDGHLLLDLRRFHDVEPTTPTPDFPYPAPTPP